MSDFDEAYAETPPWDIGRPQREIVRLEDAGEIRGSVLDVGCGTGENALYLAERGHEVWGVDSAPAAIEKAKAKVRQRGLEATFQPFDALRLEGLGRSFDTVIDSGLFHVFSDEERPSFVRSLGAVLHPGGDYFMMCFSDLQPGCLGPRRVTQGEIRAAFGEEWKVDYIREATFESRMFDNEARAWLARITRTGAAYHV
ncbi:MAG TPA: class I SAM-dependent methyltransferase [Chloroflexota bacterium]|nr:class I SAM-dependent methyltransferase [Chloroflexota bacterium]